MASGRAAGSLWTPPRRAMTLAAVFRVPGSAFTVRETFGRRVMTRKPFIGGLSAEIVVEPAKPAGVGGGSQGREAPSRRRW